MTQLPLDFTSPRPDVRFRYRLELAEETCVPYNEDVCLTRPGEIARFLTRRVFCREPREILAVLFLDVRLALIGHQIAYTGSLHRVIADPRHIFAAALLHNAAGIIVAQPPERVPRAERRGPPDDRPPREGGARSSAFGCTTT